MKIFSLSIYIYAQINGHDSEIYIDINTRVVPIASS